MQYHCVITGQMPLHGSALQMGTRAQIVTVPEGMTREQVYRHAVDALHADQGWPPNAASIIFFSLEPNVLA